MFKRIIENNREDRRCQERMSAEEIKQCFLHLHILFLADSLYTLKSVMDLYREYKWEFLIRYKKKVFQT